MSSKDELYTIILTILREHLGRDAELLKKENWDQPLTAGLFRLTAVDMCRLFFELEKRLGIRFTAEDLKTYGFRSINSICGIIEKKYLKSNPLGEGGDEIKKEE